LPAAITAPTIPFVLERGQGVGDRVVDNSIGLLTGSIYSGGEPFHAEGLTRKADAGSGRAHADA
jgi:hypothetical protein